MEQLTEQQIAQLKNIKLIASLNSYSRKKGGVGAVSFYRYIVNGTDEELELYKKIQNPKIDIVTGKPLFFLNPMDQRLHSKLDLVWNQHTHDKKELGGFVAINLEKLGSTGEYFLYCFLLEKYNESEIKWLNKEGESFCTHDFQIVNSNGEIMTYIDCKTTSKSKSTFYMSDNEWSFFMNNKSKYQIYRIHEDFSDIIHIENLQSWIDNGKIAMAKSENGFSLTIV